MCKNVEWPETLMNYPQTLFGRRRMYLRDCLFFALTDGAIIRQTRKDKKHADFDPQAFPRKTKGETK